MKLLQCVACRRWCWFGTVMVVVSTVVITLATANYNIFPDWEGVIHRAEDIESDEILLITAVFVLGSVVVLERCGRRFVRKYGR